MSKLTREEVDALRTLRTRNDEFAERHGVPDPTVATALAQATHRALPALLDMALDSARPEPSEDEVWRPVDVDRLDLLDAEFPATCCERVLLAVNRADGARFVCMGWWDAETQRWFDEETDGQNDRVVYSPGEVTHWRSLPAMPGAESKALPPSGALGLALDRAHQALRSLAHIIGRENYDNDGISGARHHLRAIVALLESGAK